MSDSLATHLLERAARRGPWCGGEVALSFGDPAGEWQALDAGAALLDASWRRLLVATGEERAAFLHGQTSNDIRSLGRGGGCAALSLNAQGRPLALFAVYDDGERLLLVTERDRREATRAALERFLVADDCEFADGPRCETLAVAGPRARQVLDTAGIRPTLASERDGGWRLSRAMLDGQHVLVLERADLRVPRYELYATDEEGRPGDALRIWKALEAAGGRACGLEALETVRVESGTARYGIDVDDSRVAVEARLEWAIHFAKGCYVGQEVIERAVSRGQVNHRLELFACDRRPAVGARVRGASAADVVTSTAISPRLGPIALAYLPRDVAPEAEGSARRPAEVELESDGETIAARSLPWPRARVLAGRD